MKLFLFGILTLWSFAAVAQQQDSTHKIVKYAPYQRHSTIATLSAGFIDQYRQGYSLPGGYEKGNTSGFAPIYGKLEYALSGHVGLAATMSYDNFVYNFSQQYTGNTGPFIRTQTDNLRVVSGGLSAYYHFGSWFHIHTLDPFIGAGLSLNNVRYSAYPQGDTSVVKLSHPVYALLRVGARYYVSPQCSFFADAGLDKQSALSVGMSCRFFQLHKRVIHAAESDADGDGIPDRIDSCPHVKGLSQFNGCPDTDGDGIPDNQDACPTVPGPAENHGCPTDSSRKAVVQMKEVTIPKNVVRFTPATAIFTDSAIMILDSTVAMLKGNSKADVSIKSYTDPNGTQPVSKKTANTRAVAIKKYFTDKGIVPARLLFTRPGAAPKLKKRRVAIEIVYDISY